MDRRHFLALIASAPIAALAPLPKLLPEPQYFKAGDVFTVNGRYVVLPDRYAISRHEWACRITVD